MIAVVENSFVCRGVAAVWRSLVRLDRRAFVGLRGGWSPEQQREQTQRVERLASGSHVMTTIARLVHAPRSAAAGAATARLVQPILELTPSEQARFAGWALIAAVLTHIVVLFAAGAGVEALGWTCRAIVLAAGILAVWTA